MTKVNLLTSNDAFHSLHETVDNQKSTVRVGRQQLLNLLIDHSAMVNALGNQVVDLPAFRPRPKLLQKGNTHNAPDAPSKPASTGKQC